MSSGKPQKGGSSSANKGKGKEVQNTKKTESSFSISNCLSSETGCHLGLRPLFIQRFSSTYLWTRYISTSPGLNQQFSSTHLWARHSSTSSGLGHRLSSKSLGQAQQHQSWGSAPTQHRSPAHVQPPSPPAPQEQPTHVPPSHHAWELEFANSTTGMSYMNMLNEVSQIPLADLGESHGHHSATSSGLSTPEGDDDDDIQQSEVKKCGRAPRPKKLPAERDPDGKPWAEPTASGFGETAINKIIGVTNILIGFLGTAAFATAAFATWREVDTNTRGQMLKEFMNKVHIRPGFTEAQVRSGFGTKCSARWREITKRIKRDYKLPRHDAKGQSDLADQQNQDDQPDHSEHGPIFLSWVQGALMEALFAHWNSKSFQDISERNTKNHGSGEGCSVHTGGSHLSRS